MKRESVPSAGSKGRVSGRRGTGFGGRSAPDRIIISDLEVRCRIGVPEAEREHPQRLLLTVEMETESGFDRAVAADDLAGTIDYYAVSRRLLEFGQGREWRLIETLAVEMAEMIVRDYGASVARVEVKKFILPEARFVAVQVERRA